MRNQARTLVFFNKFPKRFKCRIKDASFTGFMQRRLPSPMNLKTLSH